MKIIVCTLVCFLFACKKEVLVQKENPKENSVVCTKETKLDLELHTIIEREISSLKKSDAIVDVFKKYRSCIDGAISEIYDEKVSIILDTKWEDVMRNYSLDLEEALMFGVSEVWEFEISQRILDRAKNKCSEKYKKLCQKIIDDSNS